MYAYANGNIDKSKVPVLVAAGPSVELNIVLPGHKVVFHGGVFF
jgi:hypothetical protein